MAKTKYGPPSLSEKFELGLIGPGDAEYKILQEQVDQRSLAPYEQKAEEMKQRDGKQSRGGGRGAGGIDVDIEGLPQKIRPSGGRRMKKGGSVKSASARADGIAKRGKTRGRIV
jgi:hypothetical protein